MMNDVACIADVEQIAKKKISEFQWSFLRGAAEHGNTLRDNENAFRRYYKLILNCWQCCREALSDVFIRRSCDHIALI